MGKAYYIIIIYGIRYILRGKKKGRVEKIFRYLFIRRHKRGDKGTEFLQWVVEGLRRFVK